VTDGTGQNELAGLYGEFLDETRELLDALGRDLVELEQRPDDHEVVHRVFRAAHSLKGNAGFMGMEALATLAHSMENVLEAVREGSIDGSSGLLDLLFRGLDCCRTLLAGSSEGESRPPDLDDLLTRLTALRAATGPEPAAAAAHEAPADPEPTSAGAVEPPRPAPAPAKERAARDGDTLRVSTVRLDRLVNLVGELMASRSRLAALSRGLKDRSLEEVADGLSRLADQLQDEVLSIRMVPIRTLFQKFHRLVRDTAREAGKEVDLELAGEATELDRAIVEAIHDPMVHLVRNAIAHGLEPPEARRQARKRPPGRLRLAARHAEDRVVIEVADDGRGLEEEAIRRHAVEAGLIPPAEADVPLGAEAIRRLIFRPGFSTASRVDRISGRGVGLDVVRTGIEGLGGDVEVASRPGEGTTFTLRVPLTLAMIQIFLVRVAGGLYGLPLPHVDETIRVSPRDLQVVGQQRFHLLRGQAVPVVALASPFGLEPAAVGPADAAAERRPIVIVRHGDRRVGFVVDDVCGKDKTVLKPLGPYVARLPQAVRGIAGASLLGSGDVVLIVDVPGLFALVADAAVA
jgi:two-component system chemotaxis sensor kinase CheA